ncbi:MAG TPA: YlbF family regulator [Verrucomicrobiae bacterium]|nr:YlbF family regulator [Verrucomicrobiae bacterium]
MSQTIESPILAATKDLCRTIIEQPEFQSIRKQVDAFMADETAKSQYQVVVEKGEALQHKQQMGLPLSNDEISEFEQNRENLVNNPVAKGFLDAQQEMQKVQESVGQLVAKTFELGRIPSEEDLGSCGSGCGCH